MTDAYDDWRETKLRLKDEPNSVYLQRVEEALRGLALTAWLSRFVLASYAQDYDYEGQGYVDFADISQEDFLAGLDELRQPTYREDETRAEMQQLVSKTLDHLRSLNWTGDHTYGDALTDASELLRHVLAGQKGWPVLERFRCPSLYQAKKAPLPIRCEYQLPHEGKHSVANVGEWSDEQSVNPPKSYDVEAEELTVYAVRRCRAIWADKQCELPEEHEGPHRAGPLQGGRVWPNRGADGTLANPDPINRPLVDDEPADERRCVSVKNGKQCEQEAHHAGQHSNGVLGWFEVPNPDPINRPPIELTDAQLNDLGAEVFGDGECGVQHPKDLGQPREISAFCVRAKQHAGLHRDADGIRWEQ